MIYSKQYLAELPVKLIHKGYLEKVFAPRGILRFLNEDEVLRANLR